MQKGIQALVAGGAQELLRFGFSASSENELSGRMRTVEVRAAALYVDALDCAEACLVVRYGYPEPAWLKQSIYYLPLGD